MRAPAAAVLLLLGLTACSAGDDPSPPRSSPPSAPQSVSPGPSAPAPAGILGAATAFLGSLDDEERDAALFDRGDRAQQQRWSNLPSPLFQREGLMIGDLDPAEAEAFLAVMRATLSREGYERVTAAVAGDDVFAAGNGGGLEFGRRFFRIAFIGEPSATEPWQWQFGGHHVTVNATIQGDSVSVTPTMLGAQPLTYTDGGGATVRPLGDITDGAFALVNSLDGGARQRAVLGDTAIDLVLGPGQDCRTIPPEGLPGSAMTAEQQTAFLALIGEYGGLSETRSAEARTAQLRADLARTSFAWYGPTAPGSAAYFRITGPRVVIEYAPNGQGGGNPANHVHGIYRDPTDDYGGTVC